MQQMWKILQEMGIPDHFTCLLRNLYAGQEATVRIGHGTTDWFQIGKGVGQGCILSLCLFNLYAEYIGEGNGTSLQYSCLENPMDGRAWKAVVHSMCPLSRVCALSSCLIKWCFSPIAVSWIGVSLCSYRRRQLQSTPVLLPGKSYGWRSLEGCSPWGHWGSDTTERLHFHFSLSCIGEGNGNPL